jgi:ATP-dependent 26S proteasome regulatory subunit
LVIGVTKATAAVESTLCRRCENLPSIVFLDELDAIAPKRSAGGSGGGMEK